MHSAGRQDDADRLHRDVAAALAAMGEALTAMGAALAALSALTMRGDISDAR